MTILEQLYASSGSEVIHDTLQITAGDQNYWLTRGWDNITVTLEDGQQATLRDALSILRYLQGMPMAHKT
jgi:hypothetical protein